MADAVVVLPEAELFGDAEVMLVEVLGRIRPEDRGIRLPPMPDLPCPSEEAPLWVVVERYAADEAGVPARLAGAERIPSCPGLDIADPQGVIAVFADRATAAAGVPAARGPRAAAAGADVDGRRDLARGRDLPRTAAGAAARLLARPVPARRGPPAAPARPLSGRGTVMIMREPSLSEGSRMIITAWWGG